MASTANNLKRTRSNGETEDLNKKRRKTNNSSPTAKANNRKPTAKLTAKPIAKPISKPIAKPAVKPAVKPAPKRTANKKIDSKITNPLAKPKKRSTEQLVKDYYFNAPQEPNSNPEWIDYDIRVATPAEIQYAVETKCVGWSDEALIEQREMRRKKLWG